MDNEENTVRITHALLSVERKVAFARDYQSANIVSSAIKYIEELESRLEKENKEGEGEGEGEWKEVIDEA